MQVEVSPIDVNEYTADDRGRITLGVDYKNATVEVAILDDGTDD